jgi:hypothetical protein
VVQLRLDRGGKSRKPLVAEIFDRDAGAFGERRLYLRRLDNLERLRFSALEHGIASLVFAGSDYEVRNVIGPLVDGLVEIGALESAGKKPLQFVRGAFDEQRLTPPILSRKSLWRQRG